MHRQWRGVRADIGADVEDVVARRAELAQRRHLGLVVFAVLLVGLADINVLPVVEHQPVAAALQAVGKLPAAWRQRYAALVFHHSPSKRAPQ